MQLPADVRLDRTEVLFTPSDRAGALVRFGITPVRAASVTLVDGAGQPLPLGSRVRVNGQAGDGVPVGYDGLVYLDTLSDDNVLSVQTPQTTCTARFAWRRPASGVAQVGPLACLP
jgi:outer membrane usher protein